MRLIVLLATMLFFAASSASAGCRPMFLWWTPSPVQTNRAYLSITGNHAGATSSSESSGLIYDYFVAPVAMNVHSLYGYATVAPGTGNKWTYAVIKSPNTVLLSCQISDAEIECNSGTDVGEIAQGDKLYAWITSEDGDATPAFSNVANFSFCLEAQ
jgi:hypothetical protein